jgi:hypothetical protein
VRPPTHFAEPARRGERIDAPERDEPRRERGARAEERAAIEEVRRSHASRAYHPPRAPAKILAG